MTSFSDATWDGSASNYKDADAFCSACMIDLNKPGEQKVKTLCKLPYKTPSGVVSKGALRSIVGILQGGEGGVDAPADEKRKAARKAITLAKEAGIDLKEGIYRVAGLKPPAK